MGVLERSVQDQSSATEETTASVEEMTASLNNIAAMTRDRTESANQLLDSAGDGARHAEATSEKINTVARFAAEIGEMTDVIRSVAASTNMLAMNAAIEAAHAGDAGRGFAVVAGEIRKLAESAGANSSRIAKNVKEIVGGIQAATNAASENAERFGSIASEVQHIVETMEELSGAAREMSTGSEQNHGSDERPPVKQRYGARADGARAAGGRTAVRVLCGPLGSSERDQLRHGGSAGRDARDQLVDAFRHRVDPLHRRQDASLG